MPGGPGGAGGDRINGATTGPVAPSDELDALERELLALAMEAQRAEWVHATHITEDTSALAVRANARLIERTVAAIQRSRPWAEEGLDATARRKVALLRVSLPLVAPSGHAEAEELAGLVNAMQSRYAQGRVALPGEPTPRDLEGLSRLLATERDPARLAAAWIGWHEVARPMRGPFERYVALANHGAREIGFDDLGAMWRSRYDMAPEARRPGGGPPRGGEAPR